MSCLGSSIFQISENFDKSVFCLNIGWREAGRLEWRVFDEKRASAAWDEFGFSYALIRILSIK